MTREQLFAEIRRFVSTRPGFDFGNYVSDWRDTEGRKAYASDVRSATRQRRDVLDMLAQIAWRESITVEMMLDTLGTSGRLTLNPSMEQWETHGPWTCAQRLTYCAGQYYCTEYRASVAQWLARVLWRYWAENMAEGPTAAIIRAKARRELGKGLASRYFS